MIISVSAKATASEPLMLECGLTTDEFMAIFKPENVREWPQKDGRNYIAGQLLDYSKPRGKGNVLDRCAVVLDCDDADKTGVDKLVEAVKALGVRSVIHSTYSSTPNKPRVRVVIPLKDTVAPNDYVALCKALMNHLDMVTWDESCAQAERVMYMPGKRKGGEYWAKEMEGPLMDGLEWVKAREPKERKARTSKGNVAKRDRKRKPENDPGIQGAFNRVYTIEDAIETFDLPYEPGREGRWTYYDAHSEGGLRLVEGREDLCISEHANTDPACFVDGNGSVRALSAFELCAVHLYGEDDDTSLPPRERASMQKMAERAGEDEAVRAELGAPEGVANVDIAWLREAAHRTRVVAMHVAAELRDRLAYVKGFGWMAYIAEKGVWGPIDEGGAVNRVNMVAEAWEQAAIMVGDETVMKKVRPFCGTRGGRSILVHLQEMVTLAADDFDGDPDLLCVRNGVVDLRTGKLMPHDPKYRMTKRTAVAYREGATHESWNKALEALDPAERLWSQQWLGCAVTGHQPRDRGAAIPLLDGVGSNGKSVLVTGVVRAMGGYARMFSQDLLMPENSSAFAHAAVALKGLRLGLVEELRNGVLNSIAVKMLACTPTMVAEAKYQMPIEFKTTHSLMVTTNRLPRLDEGTDGVNRRLTVLHFPYHYVDSPKPGTNERLIDESLVDAIESEEVQEAILAWLIAGACRYYASGQHVQAPTEAMRAAKEEWMCGADVLADFFNNMLIEDPDAMVPWTHLCAAFCDNQRGNNGAQWNSATLKNSVVSHRIFSKFKFGKLRTSGMSVYRDKYGNGPEVPKGGRVAGLRGLRFRTEADGEPEAFEGEYVEPELEVVEPVVVAEPEPEALIPAEDIPAPTSHVAPEKDEVERQGLVEEIEGLVAFVEALPGGYEEVDRLVEETGCRSAREPLGKLRAFKIRLEGALARLTVVNREQLGIPFVEDNARRQE
nr:MAG TPA: Superfamily 3 helicase [Caudoviricetes sp.]